MQKKSGVDIDLGNRSSKIAYQYAMETFHNRSGKSGAIGSKSEGGFSNLLVFGNERLGIGSDGIGTKAELAERTGIYNTLGYDLVAMVADDLAVMGFEPTNISNVIDVDYLDPDIIDELMKGLKEACDFCGITITGGEIAELGDRIAGYGNKMHFNWSSTAIGVLHKNIKKEIDGTDIKPGDIVISLKSRGFRSNGFSSIRRILKEEFGDNWHNEKYNDKSTWGEKMLTPSLIYAPLITNLIENNLIPKGISHITGGGVFDNFRRILKATNFGAELTNLFAPLPEMNKLIELGNINNEDAYLWWNMGNGMLLVVNKSEANQIIEKASTLGYESKIAGKIIEKNAISVKFPTFEINKQY